MIERLKNLNVDTDLEDLMELSALGGLVQAEYRTQNAEEPEWLGAGLRTLRREIRTRMQDRIEKLLREKKARLEALKDPTERRAELAEQIKALEAQLQS